MPRDAAAEFVRNIHRKNAELLARSVLEALGQHLFPMDLTKAVSVGMPGDHAQRLTVLARRVLADLEQAGKEE